LVRRPEGKTPFEVPATGGKIILKWVIKKYEKSIDWIDLSEGRVK
jgi:hypothetical protein